MGANRGPGLKRSLLGPVKDEIIAMSAFLASTALTFSLLPLAARHDRHFHTASGLPGDVLVRQGAGLFVLAGLVAGLPCLVATRAARPYRGLLIAAVVIAILAGVVCELVVTIAPDPWFTF